MSDILLKKQKKCLISEIFFVLRKVGFSTYKGTTAWRRSDTKIDIMRLEFYSISVCEKWRVPIGSFSIIPSCYFPFMPSLQGAKLWPDNSEIDRLSDSYSQIRLRVFKEIRQTEESLNQSWLNRIVNAVIRNKIEKELEPLNIWWIGVDDKNFLKVIEDVAKQVESKVLIFFNRFENKNELMRTLQEEEDAWGCDMMEGIYDFGGKESIKRLCYIGFSALQLKYFDLAEFSLNKCLDKLLAKYEEYKTNTMYEGKDGIERRFFDETLISHIKNTLSDIQNRKKFKII